MKKKRINSNKVVAAREHREKMVRMYHEKEIENTRRAYFAESKRQEERMDMLADMVYDRVNPEPNIGLGPLTGDAQFSLSYNETHVRRLVDNIQTLGYNVPRYEMYDLYRRRDGVYELFDRVGRKFAQMMVNYALEETGLFNDGRPSF